ncbi:MAG: hypothetical protein GY751_00215 [Bacteroidetes bacterium]|nr:hypothetical protein [Bacteroidota bacterium]
MNNHPTLSEDELVQGSTSSELMLEYELKVTDDHSQEQSNESSDNLLNVRSHGHVQSCIASNNVSCSVCEDCNECDCNCECDDGHLNYLVNRPINQIRRPFQHIPVKTDTSVSSEYQYSVFSDSSNGSTNESSCIGSGNNTADEDLTQKNYTGVSESSIKEENGLDIYKMKSDIDCKFIDSIGLYASVHRNTKDTNLPIPSSSCLYVFDTFDFISAKAKSISSFNKIISQYNSEMVTCFLSKNGKNITRLAIYLPSRVIGMIRHNNLSFGDVNQLLAALSDLRVKVVYNMSVLKRKVTVEQRVKDKALSSHCHDHDKDCCNYSGVLFAVFIIILVLLLLAFIFRRKSQKTVTYHHYY